MLQYPKFICDWGIIDYGKKINKRPIYYTIIVQIVKYRHDRFNNGLTRTQHI